MGKVNTKDEVVEKWWIFWEEPMAGFYLRNIFVLLWQNKFRVHIKYIPRLIYGILMSFILLPLRLIESALFNGKIEKTELVDDPIIILGYYRSGTTYLNSVLARDKNLGYVSNIESFLPAIFLAFPKLTEFIIKFSLPETRPMDLVQMDAWQPNEEDYAIGAKHPFGFYNGFIFPRNFRFYSKYNSFEGMPKELARWKKAHKWFAKKMSLRYPGRRLFLQNPPSTYRIKHMLELYPNAKFILITRNPYQLYESNVRFHREMFTLYTLQTWDYEDMKQTILDNVRELGEKFEEDKHLIKDRLVHVKYEDLVQDPVRLVKEIYTKLEIPGYKEAEPAFKEFFDSQKSYKPNKYEHSDDTINRVNKSWGEMYKRFGYTLLKPKSTNK